MSVKISRRDFLKFTGVVGAGALLAEGLLVLATLTGCGPQKLVNIPYYPTR